MSDRVAFARLDHEALQRASADSEHEVAELRRELGVVTDERDTALADNDRLREDAERSFPATWAGFRAFLAEHYPADIFPGDDRNLGPQLVAAARTIAEIRAERDALSAVIEGIDVCADCAANRPCDAATALAAGLAAPAGETTDECPGDGCAGCLICGEVDPALPVEEQQR